MMRLLILFAFLLTASLASAETVRLAVTTSFHNSGLSDILVPRIKADTGIEVQLLIVGTGQALRLGQSGDVDALLVHSRAAEEAFVASGAGAHRTEIMYNDFVLLGPGDDPAVISQAKTATEAFKQIAMAQAPFVSRGDDSGTHKKELSIWKATNLDPGEFDPWYKSVGASMGASLNTAAGLDAYIMSDRASWLNFANRGNLTLLFSGDPVLFNQYAFLPVNAQRHPHVNQAAVERLEIWLTSDVARSLINGYQIQGQPLFIFNADH
jgi:tungstate transport system substrate-binding protein